MRITINFKIIHKIFNIYAHVYPKNFKSSARGAFKRNSDILFPIFSKANIPIKIN